MLDHQYSLFEPLLRVPLVVRDGRRFAPGRETRPVMNHDLFPTLLEIAGLEVPRSTRAVSLLAPREDRVRLAEYVGAFRDAFSAIEPLHPGWDRSPWEREIRALYRGGDKLIRWSDGHRELYALREDPLEERDRIGTDPSAAETLDASLAVIVAGLRIAGDGDDAVRPISEEQRELLRSLGYIHDGTERTREP